jgi:hypothetical protein
MTHGDEKSGPAIVAVKPANKGRQLSAESVEPRAGAKGNAIEQGMRRTPGQESMSTGWIVYGKRQIKRMNGSPHCCIISMSNCWGRPMAGCGKRRRRVWMG